MARKLYDKLRKSEGDSGDKPEEFKKNVSKLEPYVAPPEVLQKQGFIIKPNFPEGTAPDTVFRLHLTGPTSVMYDGSAMMEFRDGATELYFEYGAGTFTASFLLCDRRDGAVIKMLNTVKFDYDGAGVKTIAI